MGGGVFSQSENSKSSKGQDLPKFEFSGGGGYPPKVKPQNLLSAKICLNLKTQSAKSQPNFHWGGGGGKMGTKSQNRVNWDFQTKFSTTPASYCIADSLSHTTYVETNQQEVLLDH